MTRTNIEWSQESWNPIVGCSIVSPGCTNCYAMAMAARIEAMNAEARAGQRADGKPRTVAAQYDGTTQKVNGNAVWTGHLTMAGDKTLLAPLKRKKPTTYFVNSMGDLFHEAVPDDWIDKVFAVMALTPQHTYQVLTKRSARMRTYLSMARAHPVGLRAFGIALDEHARNPQSTVGTGVVLQGDVAHLKVWPLPNVWLGVSTERQQEADERIPDLLATPAAIRFISAEPLLGPISLRWAAWDNWKDVDGNRRSRVDHLDGARMLDWVIVGGESGPDARPMHPDWARSLRDQCTAAGVPFFFKQWGEHVPAELIKNDERPEPWRRAPNGSEAWSFTEFGQPRESLPDVTFSRVGKGNAGRALDGLIHDEYPEVAL